MIIIVSLIRLQIPAHAYLFFQGCMVFAKMDILSGETLFAEYFYFKKTDPYTEALEQFGFETTNFMINSGSFFPILVGVGNWLIFKYLVNRACTRFYRIKLVRSVGVWSYEANSKMKAL